MAAFGTGQGCLTPGRRKVEPGRVLGDVALPHRPGHISATAVEWYLQARVVEQKRDGLEQGEVVADVAQHRTADLAGVKHGQDHRRQHKATADHLKRALFRRRKQPRSGSGDGCTRQPSHGQSHHPASLPATEPIMDVGKLLVGQRVGDGDSCTLTRVGDPLARLHSSILWHTTHMRQHGRMTRAASIPSPSSTLGGSLKAAFDWGRCSYRVGQRRGR